MEMVEILNDEKDVVKGTIVSQEETKFIYFETGSKGHQDIPDGPDDLCDVIVTPSTPPATTSHEDENAVLPFDDPNKDDEVDFSQSTERSDEKNDVPCRESDEIDDEVRRGLMLLSLLSLFESSSPPEMYDTLLSTPTFSTITSFLSPQDVQLCKNIYSKYNGDDRVVVKWSSNVMAIVNDCKASNGDNAGGNNGDNEDEDDEGTGGMDGGDNEKSVSDEAWLDKEKHFYDRDNDCYDSDGSIEQYLKEKKGH